MHEASRTQTKVLVALNESKTESTSSLKAMLSMINIKCGDQTDGQLLCCKIIACC